MGRPKRLKKSLKSFLYDSSIDMKDRSFFVFSASYIVAIIAAVAVGILLKEPVSSVLSSFLLAGVCAVLLNLALKHGRIKTTRIVVAILLVCVFQPLQFFAKGGIYCGDPLTLILGSYYLVLILDGGFRIAMCVLDLFVLAGCWLTAYMRPELVAAYSRDADYVYSFAKFVITMLVLTVIITFQTRLYQRESRLAAEKAAQLEELNRSQNRFFSSMSHEIRTPINSILGLNELILRQEDTSDEVARDAQNIQGAGKMLLALINDILDFSKIEAGSMDIVPVEYHVSDMISEIVNMIWLRANEKGLRFNVDVDPRVPSILFGDEVRIKQILVNLLNNAVKYTQEGSVGLHIESESAGENRVLLKISVSDTGMGIKQEAIPYLFDAFKRVDQEKNRRIEGTGLGLSIVKQLVELMHGTVTVNSVYTQGSTFTVNLEQGVVDGKEIGDISITNSESGLARRKHERRFSAPEATILIVDDNEMNLEVERKLLDDTDMTVDTAQSGAEALEKTLLTRYDVILMDHLMPEMDGIECLEQIRNQTGGLNRNVPVVVLTANAGGENRELYNNAGFDGYLVKPVSGRQLEDMLLKHLPGEKVFRAENNNMTGEEMNTAKGYSRKLPVLITTSSMSDLPVAVIRHLGLSVIPFTVRTAEGVFRDGVDIGADELIRYINAEKGEAISSPPTASDFTKFFGSALKRAHQVIHIALTTSMSEEYHRAVEAAKSFENVTVINSECLSSATGLLVMIAYKLAKQNRSAEEIVEELERVKKQIHCSFIINTTDFMARNGRIGKTGNAFARALELHPCLRIRNDRSEIGGVWLGKTRRCYDRYIQSALGASSDPDTDVLFITYADIPEEDLNWIAARVLEYVPFDRVIFQQASAAISANCGPGAFGLLYLDRGGRSYNLNALIPEEQTAAEAADHEEAPAASAPPAQPQPQPEESGDEDPWLAGVNGIDRGEALKNCGRMEVLRTALELFYKKIGPDTDEIESLWRGGDLKNYTVKVHALKSAARTIGAMELSALAKAMEDAGKAEDAALIDEKTPELLELYRSYADILRPSFESGGEDEREPVDEGALAEAYAALAECAGMMDYDMAEMALDSLKPYRLPPEDETRVEHIRSALLELDWERVAALCKR